MKTKKLAVAVGVILLSAQLASAAYSVCIRISIGVVAAGVYYLESCSPPWRCWGIPIDEDQPWLGMATNFPSQILYRSGRASGWVTARNITFKTREACIARGCTTNNLTPNDVAIEEYLMVEESVSPDGPWTYSRTILQSPDDLDISVTNSSPNSFFRVVSTNAPPDVLMRPPTKTKNTTFWRVSAR